MATGLPEEIVLHIGMTKAGSTSLQNVLDFQRTALRERGVLFPLSGMSRRDPTDPSRTSGHLQLSRMLDSGAAGLLERECAAAGRMRYLLLSAENLFLDQTDDKLKRLGALFAGRRVHLIAILRHQLDWIPARWRESVMGNRAEGRSINRFVLSLLASGAFDYAARLERVAHLMRAEQVTAFDYGVLRRNGTLVDTVLAEVGVSLNTEGMRDLRWNVSTGSVEETEAIRRINAAFNNLPRTARRVWLDVINMPGSSHCSEGPVILPTTLHQLQDVIGPANDILTSRYLSGAKFQSERSSKGRLPCESRVRTMVQRALKRMPSTIELQLGLELAANDLYLAYEACQCARVIMHLDCGNLALLAAGIPEKLIIAVEPNAARARQLQLRAAQLDLPSLLIAEGALGSDDFCEGMRRLASKTWFPAIDLLFAPENKVGDKLLSEVLRLCLPTRVIRTPII